jgi:hypothetical protein
LPSPMTTPRADSKLTGSSTLHPSRQAGRQGSNKLLCV